MLSVLLEASDLSNHYSANCETLLLIVLWFHCPKLKACKI